MDEYFDKIACFLKKKSRLSFTGHKRSVLQQRLENRRQQLGLADISCYWNALNNSSAEEMDLYNLVTTNETSFFRNSSQFHYFKEVIIKQQTTKRIRILSAGCSTGEEPYSIAMTIFDTLENPQEWQIEIVAGDLSDNCLNVAREGYYDAEKLSKIPENYIDRFMTTTDDGAVVKDPLKKIIRFTRLNLNDLMNAELPSWNCGIGTFDVIFCRNVMIYFAPPCQQLLVDTLHKLILPEGYLFTGDAEPLHLFRHEFKAVHQAGCLVYQKTPEPGRYN
ncbi:MAG: protein-glutamate O-methyltransferase CheR [Geobacteraceae bacterium]|nr:protein-glutamate O-methyltransferase CheR [Geobacteraceae bacterium]